MARSHFAKGVLEFQNHPSSVEESFRNYLKKMDQKLQKRKAVRFRCLCVSYGAVKRKSRRRARQTIKTRGVGESQ